MSGDDSFIARWARRKQAAGTAAPEEPATVPDAPAAAPPDTRPDDEILEELGLPDPASLKPGDDIRGFMQDAVPAHLRRLALRQLWRSNPVLANLDELLEYGEDYTDAAMVVENLQTAYQVGRGFWTEEDEQRALDAAAEKLAGAGPDDDQGTDPMTGREATDAETAPNPETMEPASEPQGSGADGAEPGDLPAGAAAEDPFGDTGEETPSDPPEPAVARRRMAFR